MAKKIAEIRINGKVGIVQIKMNQGPNYTLKGEDAIRFEQKRNQYIAQNVGKSERIYPQACENYKAITQNV